MVGVPGKSLGCNTCRRRKVKCDLQKPHCLRCITAARKCEGYARFPVFINRSQGGLERRRPLEEAKSDMPAPVPGVCDERLVSEPSPGPANETQLISSFWHLYATEPSSQRPRAGELAWLHYSITSPARPRVLQRALLSMVYVRLGRLDGQQDLVIRGQQQYGQALRLMQDALYDQQLMHSDEVLVAARCMVLYEAFESTSGDVLAWQHHISGIARIMEARGVHRHRSWVPRSVLESMRYNIMIDSLMRRRASFLGKTEWLTEPWVATSKGLEQELYDHGFALAQMTCESEKTQPRCTLQEVPGILERIRNGYLSLTAINERLLAMRDGRPPAFGNSAEEASNRLDEAVFSINFAILTALDLNHSLFASALVEAWGDRLQTAHPDLLSQISRYTNPQRRLQLSRQLLRHLQSSLKKQSKHMRPTMIYPLNVIRWELRKHPDEAAKIKELFETITTDHHFRIARGIQNTGRSVLPALVAVQAASVPAGRMLT